MEQAGHFIACRQCLWGLADSAAEMAAKDDPELATGAREAARRILERGWNDQLSTPELASRMYREIKRVTGSADPYAGFKAREMELAHKATAGARKGLSFNLRSRIAFAALGNSLDFFRPASEVQEELRNRARDGIKFYHDDTDIFESILEEKPARSLYLADNAGEFYFDLPLIEYLASKTSGLELVVKGGPSLNDLTRAELSKVNLEGLDIEVSDTGGDGVGVDWEHASPEFLAKLGEADLILAKGMANLETMLPRPLPTPVLFIFKAKCRPLQELWNAPPDSYWAYWRQAGQG